MVVVGDYRIRSRVEQRHINEVEAIIDWTLPGSTRAAILKYGGLWLRRVAGLKGLDKFAISGFHSGDDLVSRNQRLRDLAGPNGRIPMEFGSASGGDSVVVLPDESVGLVDLDSGRFTPIALGISEFVSMLELAGSPDSDRVPGGRVRVNPKFADQLEELRKLSRFER